MWLSQCNCEPCKLLKTLENQRVQTGQVGFFSKPPHSAALPPLRGLVSTAYHRTCDALVAKRWLDGSEGWKTAIRGALDIRVVAKFQFQLPSVFFRLSQFFDPRLYFLYC